MRFEVVESETLHPHRSHYRFGRCFCNQNTQVTGEWNRSCNQILNQRRKTKQHNTAMNTHCRVRRAGWRRWRIAHGAPKFSEGRVWGQWLGLSRRRREGWFRRNTLPCCHPAEATTESPPNTFSFPFPGNVMQISGSAEMGIPYSVPIRVRPGPILNF